MTSPARLLAAALAAASVTFAAVLVCAPAGVLAQEQAGPQAPAPATAPKAATPPVDPNRNDLVTEIQVDGLRRVEREAALAGTKTKVGQPLDPAVLTQDLHAVWQTGFFRDVRIETEKVKGGYKVYFIVLERPSIRDVKFVGRGDISEEDIRGVVDVRAYTILNIDLLKRNVEKIRDLYVQKGYYLADVKYRIEALPGSTQEVDVFFDIVENAKVIVRQITFIGNKHLSSDYLKSGIQTREGGELSWITSTGTYKEEYFQTDLFRIQAAYYDAGFVTVKVGEPTATISPDRRYIYLSVPITEGEQYNIGKIGFAGDVTLKNKEGETVVDENRLKSVLSIGQGEIFNRSKLFSDINSLTDVYRDQGYAFANVTPNSAIHEDTKTVDLELEVERGDVVYFDRIEVAGNTRTRDRVVRRELKIYEGDRYSASQLNLSRARVYALGYFETVNVTTSRGSKPDRMDVRVEVKEKSTGTFQVGAGFSSVESFILQAQISQNNFLGNGWLVSLSAQLSFGNYARRLATLQFYDPYFLDSKWSFGIDAYSTQRYYPEFRRDSTGFSPRLGYPITDDIRLTAGYTLERVDVRNGTNSIGSTGTYALYGLTTQGLNSSVNSSISFDTRDNRLFPSRGQYHVLMGELSAPALGSAAELSFWRGQLMMRFYRPIFWQFVLKLNVELGWVGGVGGHPAPIAERFFPGGILSVRGFEPRGLGPTVATLATGDPASATTAFPHGGNKQAILNLELEFPLIEQAGIKGVLFADAGNAFDDTQNFFYVNTPNELKPKAYLWRGNRQIEPPLGMFYSIGFGFRWFSPIGPLRFEWGIPITKPSPTSRGLIFEFTIGNFF
jgi:outer membrane protein insertion porin family